MVTKLDHEARIALLAAIPQKDILDFYTDGIWHRLVPGETWQQFVYGGDEPFKPEPTLTTPDDNHAYL